LAIVLSVFFEGIMRRYQRDNEKIPKGIMRRYQRDNEKISKEK
jgi:hypothetical protein